MIKGIWMRYSLKTIFSRAIIFLISPVIRKNNNTHWQMRTAGNATGCTGWMTRYGWCVYIVIRLAMEVNIFGAFTR